jgi:RNA polymerase sigma-70 factor (ECF subfamily)
MQAVCPHEGDDIFTSPRDFLPGFLVYIEVMDDERLLIEAAQRDPRRFADLYERNFERVYAFIARRVLDRHEAEDVTAEVFQHALANLNKFEWRGVPFAVWLFRIAVNAMADRRKVRSRESINPTSDDLDQPHWPDIERRVVLFRLVDDLPADQRTVIVKRFVEQKSIRDIAAEFGRTEGAIKQLQFRALETLRRAWVVSHE